MSSLIISASKGTDDPTMATLAFIAAKVATDEGHQVILWLQNEAVVLAKKGIALGNTRSRTQTPQRINRSS